MTNEEKAFKIQRQINDDKENYETVAGEAYCGAMMMAKWKDKQFEEAKQALIGKVYEWLIMNITDCNYITVNRSAIYRPQFLENFKEYLSTL